MSPSDLRKLRQHVHSLRNVLTIVDETRADYIDGHLGAAIQYEIGLLLSDFPGMLPEFNFEQLLWGISSDRRKLYDKIGLRTYLSRVIGRIQLLTEDQPETPVTQQRDFGFVRNAELRRIIERDFAEVQRAFSAECWKSSIVLVGGMIEAILSDLLIANQVLVARATKAPKNSDITRWDLVDLIHVAVELKLVNVGVEKLSHPIREFRNLIHPGNEIRNNLQFGAEEARIALEVLNIVHRGLSPAKTKENLDAS